MFNCNSFGAEGIGENNRNRNARQLEGYTGPWVWRTFGIWISYVGFLKKCFHLVICISIFDGNPDFRYKTVYWLWPGTIHKTSSVVIPANFRRVFASHLTSGHPFNWFFFSMCLQFHLLLRVLLFFLLQLLMWDLIKCINIWIVRQRN